MLSVLVPIALLAQSQSIDAKVEDLVLRLQQQAYRSSNTAALDKQLSELGVESAPALTGTLAKISDRVTFKKVGAKLRKLEYQPAISALVHILDKRFDGLSERENPVRVALNLWDYKATPAILRGVDSPNAAIHIICSQMICERAWNERKNPKVAEILLKSAQSPILEIRKAAFSGLQSYSLEYHLRPSDDYMGPTIVTDKAGFEALCRLAVDRELRGGALLHSFVYGHRYGSSYQSYKYPGESGNLKDFTPNRDQLYESIADKDPIVGMAAAACVAAFGEEVQAMYRTLSSKQKPVRDFGEYLLEVTQQKYAIYDFVPWLEKLSQNEDPAFRITAASALGKTRKSNALPVLKKLLADSHSEVRKTATQAIELITRL